MRRLQRQIHIHFGNPGHTAEHFLDPGRTGGTGHAGNIEIGGLLDRIVAERPDLLLKFRHIDNAGVKANRRLLQREVHIGPRYPLHPGQPFLNARRARRTGHAGNLQGSLLFGRRHCFFHVNHSLSCTP
ncbi:hypothetical protein D3C71_1628130 [compost metagenome]